MKSVGQSVLDTSNDQRISDRQVSTTVLVVDHDLGFVFWLGHALDNAGYSTLPAKTIPDAALLMLQLDLKVELLVINVSLPGVSEFVAAVHRNHSSVKVIGIVDNTPDPPPHIPGVNATHPKPISIDAAAKAAWIDCIQSVLQQNVLPQGALH